MTEAEVLSFDFKNAYWLGLRRPEWNPDEYKEFIRVQDRVREELKKQPEQTHPLIHSHRLNIGVGSWMAQDGTFVWYQKELLREASVKVLHQGIAAHFRSQLRRCDTLCSENLDAPAYDKWLRSLAAAITAFMKTKN